MNEEEEKTTGEIRYVFYSIGTDDCKIPSKEVSECLMKEFEQVSLNKSQFALIYDETGDQSLLPFKDTFEKNGLVILKESEVDFTKVHSIAVGSIRALRRGGDFANIKLFKRFDRLEACIKAQTGGNKLAQVGQAMSISIAEDCNKTEYPSLKSIILVVPPNMNPKRAECNENLPQVKEILSKAFKSMFVLFGKNEVSKTSSIVLSSSSESKDVEEEIEEEDNSNKRLKRTDSTEIRSIGLGTLPFGVSYPNQELKPNENTVIQIVRDCAYQNSSKLLVDAADTYCHGPNDMHSIEKILGKAMKDIPSLKNKIYVATKTGMFRVNSESNGWRVKLNLSKQDVRKSIKETLSSFGIPKIFLYQLHHADAVFNNNPAIFEEILKEMIQLKHESLIEYIGLCNCTKEILLYLKKNNLHTDIYSIQNEYNFWQRTSENKGILTLCKGLGLVFIAHSPFGGLKTRRGERSISTSFPICDVIAKKRKSCTAAQVYLKYLVHRLEAKFGVKKAILIPGARTVSNALENAAVDNLEPLTSKEIELLDRGWQKH